MWLWLWLEAAAPTPIWPPAWELPYATVVALKKKKKKTCYPKFTWKCNEQRDYSLQNQSTKNAIWSSEESTDLECVWVFFFFVFSRAAPAAYGGSQARGLIGAVTASLHHSHSNLGSELCLWPTHSSQQPWILNPLSKARDWTRILMDASRVLNPLSHNRNSCIIWFNLRPTLSRSLQTKKMTQRG